eukprot:6008862-Prymnesium_polylepis.1
MDTLPVCTRVLCHGLFALELGPTSRTDPRRILRSVAFNAVYEHSATSHDRECNAAAIAVRRRSGTLTWHRRGAELLSDDDPDLER